jgi:hypothetical protein
MVFDIVKREKHETLLRIVPREGRSCSGVPAAFWE